MTTPLLELTGLHKRYGRHAVLRGVELSIAPGSHVGLVGNNGQGKTTLLRIVMGLLRPDSGSVRLRGASLGFPRRQEQKRLFGYLPEAVSFYPGLTGRRTLHYLAALKGVPRDQVAPLLDVVGLAHAADARVKTYSKGMRQRLGLAQALLGDPAMLLLDEPTNGLDPDGIREFYAILERLMDRDVAILTASHLLSEIEVRLDGMALLRDGRLVEAAPIPELVARAGLPTRIFFSLKPGPGLPQALLTELRRRSWPPCRACWSTRMPSPP
jgi:Cu-processing system ATP-binding protein